MQNDGKVQSDDFDKIFPTKTKSAEEKRTPLTGRVNPPRVEEKKLVLPKAESSLRIEEGESGEDHCSVDHDYDEDDAYSLDKTVDDGNLTEYLRCMVIGDALNNPSFKNPRNRKRK